MRATRNNPRTRRGQPWKVNGMLNRLFHAGSIALLLFSIFGSLYVAQPVLAQQQDNTPPPFPAPNSVVVAGSFQTALGCGSDFDKDCGLTELQQQSDGTWVNAFQIPAGSYTYRIVARADIDRSFGEDGDPDGDDIQLDVPEGTLGVFFSFNQLTGEIYHAPILNQVELSTDLGQFPMTPDADGGYFTVINTDPGIAFGAQVVLDGNPVGDIASVDSGNVGRVVVTFDSGGNIDSESVEPAALTVTKTDADGNPLTGSCFSVYDGDEVAGQACDTDDGEDGSTRIAFPLGVGGGLTLAESRTPDGQDVSPSQDISIDPGENQIGVTVRGGRSLPPDDEPTEEGADEVLVTVQFIMVDEAGNAIPGGCIVLDGVGELCDDDGDAVITFEGVPGNTSYQVSESAAPDGYESFDGTSIDVFDADAQFQVPHAAAQVEPEFGALLISSTDDQGNVLTGNCFTVEPRGDTQGDETTVCDSDDGNNDGQTSFPQLNAGEWRITQESGTDGYELAERFNTTIVANETTQENVVNPQTGGGIGNLILYTNDENGNPVPGVCYDVTGQGQQCDEDGDGDMGLVDLPAGEYTAQQVSVPDGYQLDDQPQTVTVESGQDASLTFTSPTAEAETFAVRIDVFDQDGNAVGGVCFTVNDLNGNEVSTVCDDDADGDARFDLEDGDYTLVTAQAPDGYEGGDDVPFSVQGDNVDLQVTVNATATEEPTEEPTDEAGTGEGTGTMNVAVTDSDGFAIIGACVQIDGAVSGEICDNGNGDSNPEDGFIQIDGLPAGDYNVAVSQLPDGFDPAPPITVTVESGTSTDGFLVSGGSTQPDEPTATAEPETGNLLIRKYDENRDDLAGACFSLTDSSGGVIELCDNGNGDEDTRDGRLRINGLTPGDYTLTETQAPEGYSPAEPQTITIVAGETARVNVDNLLALGTVVIRTGDGTQLLGGACYELSGFGQVCDEDGDGVVQFDDVAAGDYSVTQVSVPDGYSPSDPIDQAVTVTAGATSELDFVIALALGSLQINVVDEGGNPGRRCLLHDQ